MNIVYGRHCIIEQMEDQHKRKISHFITLFIFLNTLLYIVSDMPYIYVYTHGRTNLLLILSNCTSVSLYVKTSEVRKLKSQHLKMNLNGK